MFIGKIKGFVGLKALKIELSLASNTNKLKEILQKHKTEIKKNNWGYDVIKAIPNKFKIEDVMDFLK